MSTASLPSYVAPSVNRIPSYSAEPHDHEQRIALADRLRPRPSGTFIKELKGGGVRLRLTMQEDNAPLPIYGSGSQVEGYVDLSKLEGITSVEVKIEGRLLLKEIAEGGTSTARLCLNTALLWCKDPVNTVCPSSLHFSLGFPSSFSYEDKTFPLPPTFDVKLSGLPGFVATIDYSVTAVVAKPNSAHIPNVKSKKLRIHIGSTVVSTPLIYYPRNRPASPLPLLLQHLHSGFQVTPDWKAVETILRSKSAPVPFHLTLHSSAVSLATYLPMSPTAKTLSPRKVTRVQLMRQTTVDVRNTVIAGVKTDMWRVDCIGEGAFKHAGDGPTWIAYTGEIVIDETVKVPGFKAAGLSVKDCILFTVNPLDPSKSPFGEVREVIPVRLATEPWTPNGAGMVSDFTMNPSPKQAALHSLRGDHGVHDVAGTDPTVQPGGFAAMPPSHEVAPTKVDTLPQQGSTQPGDGATVHAGGESYPTEMSASTQAQPTQMTGKVPFKEQVVDGYVRNLVISSHTHGRRILYIAPMALLLREPEVVETPTLSEKPLDLWMEQDDARHHNPVIETSKYAFKATDLVQINDEGVKHAAKHIRQRLLVESYTPRTWRTHPLHICPPEPYDPDDPLTKSVLDWIFLISSLNFSFWSEKEGRSDRYGVEWLAGWDSKERKVHTGYWSLVAALDRGASLEEDIPITDPRFYSSETLCPDSLIEHVFREAKQSTESIPLLKERIAVMREVGFILCNSFGGSFKGFLEEFQRRYVGQGTSLDLVRMVTDTFPSFRDEVYYEGTKVCLWKRAQILVAETWAAFFPASAEAPHPLFPGPNGPEIRRLTMFADYRVPQILYHLCILTYPPPLLRKLHAHTPLPSGSRGEEGGENSDKVSNAGVVSSVLIDFYLWDLAKKVESGEERVEGIETAGVVPIHRTRSIWY
ncbi:hypothetical protein NLJ89_g8111 [Agrocybe chaxingu]|uniref:Queuosine 5'-phosphate N-glycosylase/hydrolase n=1 Tax=Agrocybe chaxingu TaxID=84603 RepID=A0A9W8MT20_9AGAR|nr:hypothetical protein NLJ89_g8111 [Agrocybe chaxingu]